MKITDDTKLRERIEEHLRDDFESKLADAVDEEIERRLEELEEVGRQREELENDPEFYDQIEEDLREEFENNLQEAIDRKLEYLEEENEQEENEEED